VQTARNSKIRHIYLLMKFTTFVDDFHKNIKKLLALLFSFLFGIVSILIENRLNTSFSIDFLANNYLYIFICGIVMSAGIVIPGVSNTMLLMSLGVYSYYINAVSTLNLHFLVPLGIGVLIGSIFWIFVMKYLFSKHYSSTFYAIIGFTLGSIFVLIPDFSFNYMLLVDLLLFVFAFFISNKLA
jgi:putative membrane protein